MGATPTIHDRHCDRPAKRGAYLKQAESQRKAAKGGMRVIKLANKSVAAGDTYRPKAGRL